MIKASHHLQSGYCLDTSLISFHSTYYDIGIFKVFIILCGSTDSIAIAINLNFRAIRVRLLCYRYLLISCSYLLLEVKVFTKIA